MLLYSIVMCMFFAISSLMQTLQKLVIPHTVYLVYTRERETSYLWLQHSFLKHACFCCCSCIFSKFCCFCSNKQLQCLRQKILILFPGLVLPNLCHITIHLALSRVDNNRRFWRMQRQSPGNYRNPVWVSLLLSKHRVLTWVELDINFTSYKKGSHLHIPPVWSVCIKSGQPYAVWFPISPDPFWTTAWPFCLDTFRNSIRNVKIIFYFVCGWVWEGSANRISPLLLM